MRKEAPVAIGAWCFWSRYYFTVEIGGYRDNNGHKPAPGPGRVRRLGPISDINLAAEAIEIPQCGSLSGSPHRLSAVLFSPP
jgi:hypothetical protein